MSSPLLSSAAVDTSTVDTPAPGIGMSTLDPPVKHVAGEWITRFHDAIHGFDSDKFVDIMANHGAVDAQIRASEDNRIKSYWGIFISDMQLVRAHFPEYIQKELKTRAPLHAFEFALAHSTLPVVSWLAPRCRIKKMKRTYLPLRVIPTSIRSDVLAYILDEQFVLPDDMATDAASTGSNVALPFVVPLSVEVFVRQMVKANQWEHVQRVLAYCNWNCRVWVIAFVQAVKSNRISITKRLIREFGDDVPETEFRDAICMAVQLRHLEMAEFLILDMKYGAAAGAVPHTGACCDSTSAPLPVANVTIPAMANPLVKTPKSKGAKKRVHVETEDPAEIDTVGDSVGDTVDEEPSENHAHTDGPDLADLVEEFLHPTGSTNAVALTPTEDVTVPVIAEPVVKKPKTRRGKKRVRADVVKADIAAHAVHQQSVNEELAEKRARTGGAEEDEGSNSANDEVGM